MHDLDLLKDHLATIVAEELATLPKSAACQACGRPFHDVQQLQLDQSPRGRATREITRIIERNEWGVSAVTEWMDDHCVRSLTEVPEQDLWGLRDWLQDLRDAADTACDSRFSPPAR